MYLLCSSAGVTKNGCLLMELVFGSVGFLGLAEGVLVLCLGLTV